MNNKDESAQENKNNRFGLEELGFKEMMTSGSLNYVCKKNGSGVNG